MSFYKWITYCLFSLIALSLSGCSQGLEVKKGSGAATTGMVVADTGNNRILIWNTLPTSDNQIPDNVVGQPDFSTTSSSATSVGFASPTAAIIYQSNLIVADTGHHRVLIWNSVPSKNTTAANIVLGHTDFTTTNAPSSPTSTSLYGPSDISYTGGFFVVTSPGENRVLLWSSLPTYNAQPANYVIGQPNFVTSSTSVTANNLSAPTSVYFSSTLNSVFVSDTGYNRVLLFNNFYAPGSNAQFVVGQQQFTTSYSNVPSLYMKSPAQVFNDGSHIYVADKSNHRVLIWNTGNFVLNGQAPSVILGQSDINGVSSNRNQSNPSDSTLSSPTGVVSDGTRLYVTDSGNNRILIWNTIPTANAQAADLLIGQSNFFTGASQTSGSITGLTFSNLGHINIQNL